MIRTDRTMNTCGSRRHLRLGGALAAAALLLGACNGFEASSKASERAGYRMSFSQVPLVSSKANPGRTLNMHVFAGSSGQMPRSAQEIPFHAQLRP